MCCSGMGSLSCNDNTGSRNADKIDSLSVFITKLSHRAKKRNFGVQRVGEVRPTHIERGNIFVVLSALFIIPRAGGPIAVIYDYAIRGTIKTVTPVYEKFSSPRAPRVHSITPSAVRF